MDILLMPLLVLMALANVVIHVAIVVWLVRFIALGLARDWRFMTGKSTPQDMVRPVPYTEKCWHQMKQWRTDRAFKAMMSAYHREP